MKKQALPMTGSACIIFIRTRLSDEERLLFQESDFSSSGF